MKEELKKEEEKENSLGDDWLIDHNRWTKVNIGFNIFLTGNIYNIYL